MILNSMHKTRLHIIRIFTLLLMMMVGSIINEAWAAKKVTYHILTKPFTVKRFNGVGDFHPNIRVEALQCTSEEATVGLPDQYKSPLATGYRYWGSATPTYTQLYDNGHSTKIINTKYYIYDCSGDGFDCLSNELTAGDPVGDYTDIYVTYDYIGSNSILDINGGTSYNVGFTNGGNQKFMCYNRSRNNRIANALSSGLSGEQLASDDFVIPENGSSQLGWKWSKWGPIGLFAGFKFTGQDPYNITITTSYEGKELHITDAITNVDNTGTVKPYAGSTLMCKIGATSMWFDVSNNKHYKIQSGIKSAGEWTEAKYAECWEKFYVTQKDAQYDDWHGFYRSESPTLNAFALLNNKKGGYMFVGSKMNQGDGNSTSPTTNQPNASNQYYSYYDNYDSESGNRRSQPYFKAQAVGSALSINFYEIKTYTVHVTPHGYGSPAELTATMKWSDARIDNNPADHVPDVLKRKYVSYTAYSDAAHNNPVTSFEDIQKANNGNNIYLDYTVSESLPFDTLTAKGGVYDYKDARWYTMRMDGVANPKYIAYEGSSNKLVVTDGSGAAKGSNTASQIHQGEASPEAMVAFIGDPYRLRILNRKACEDASGNKFIGCNTGSANNTDLSTNMTGTLDITTWEIMYESIGEAGMLLRQYGTASANPRYINLGSAANDKPVTYSSDSIRIRVVELEKLKYYYHIVRNDDGDIAVKASDSHDVGKALKSWTDIPAVIRSPFLSSATVTYHGSLDDAKAGTPVINNAPYDSNRDIFVRYSGTPSVDPDISFNVTLNAEYIYTSETSEDANIYSKESISTDETANGHFQWILDYSDPYAMIILNNGKEKYIKTVSTLADNTALGWDTKTNASLFIAKQSADNPGFYEVMVATGDGVDASETYYNIGRNISSTTENAVKLYKNTTYSSGYNQLRFKLIGTSARDVTYHLIDMAHNELLQVTTRHTSDDAPFFPPRYRSPLVNTYYYWSDLSCTIPVGNEIGNMITNIYVTYDVNDLVNLKAGQLYLLQYEAGQMFNDEDGSDGISKTAHKAIYPYVNGDGNFFVYGQEQYDIQQQGASSTRTRWAWYVESNVEGAPKGDPYHVTIKSRQTESYPISNSSEYNAYFMTYKPDGYSEVVTTLGWPGMNSETATEYMVLGSEGQYQLVTSNEIGGSRYVVNSFEQYWKTWDTIRKKVYGESSAKENDSDPTTIPLDTKAKVGSTTGVLLRDSLQNTLGFHSYEKWAYAKRWNGYNNGYSSQEGTHEKKKGWEKIEHWYQTVNMGEGYFDFVKTSIDPVLILLDQHGWEIMRKPLPTSPDDPDKEAKYAAIRPYNSPMVKEYAFWATTKKRTGFHQYYLLSDRIGGDDFTSTDLTNLPPYGSKNVLDKKGNQNDQYVTYIVKDEYAQTYTPSTSTGKPFLIEQGTDHKYATTNAGGTTLTASDIPQGGDMKAHILKDNILDTEKWYVKPNDSIDNEMGYNDVVHTWTKKKADGNWDNKNPNAYDHKDFKNNFTATYLSLNTHAQLLIDSLGYFSFSNGFDPYNIQISSVSAPSKFMKTDANGATLEEGSLIGSYPAVPGTIAMGDTATVITPNPKWYDSRNLSVTNATYMAVQDADGNMQLMPRFDHSTRMAEFGTLIAPTDDDVAKTYTKLYRPEVYEYLIIDNDGKESIRYKTGGDLMPQTPAHFQSPLATNFTYYATATKTGDTYSNITDEIETSLDGTTLTENTLTHNKVVYVRYEYDEESDNQNMLKGNWLTMQLCEKNAIYNSGIKQAGGDKPATIDGDDKQWQWKFAHNSQPDPYAIYIYNRSQAEGTKAIEDRFALLSHSAGDYALAQAGQGTVANYDYTYKFLNGNEMNTETPASVAVEPGFISTSGTFDETKSQVKFADDVTHTFIYKVYTNGGVEAISVDQSQEDVISNDWKPVLPGAARTPLLNTDQYRYYEQDLEGAVAVGDTLDNALSLLYGLYDDIVYTHYTAYNPNVSSYVVPNVRNTPGGTVAKGVGSNDTQIGLDGKRPYNIIWYADYMMRSDGTSITSEANKELQTSAAFEWEFDGDDPYAIKIKSVGETNKYIHAATPLTTELSTTATPFMLLYKDGYDYGVFAKTGDATTKLSGYGNTLTTGDPEHFIPFALSTFKVIYHLMIKNIGEDVRIPYRGTETGGVVAPSYKIMEGTTLRDLESRNSTGGIENHIDGDKYQLGSTLRDSTYCVDAGHVSLGDAFEIPQVFYRPNVIYHYYIGGVYDQEWNDDDIMNAEYKGLELTNMGEDTGLLGKIVWVNIVYKFLGGLETNAGTGFVTSVDDNMWYTFETSDATPMLAEFTGTLQTKSGYATHYTNDYLWTPVGDPYGFKMYNRYLHKNLRESKVMSTSDFTTDRPIEMVADDASKPYLPANSVYELLANNLTTPGYFRVHPVVNMHDVTQYYIKNNSSTGAMALNATPTEWTFSINEDLMRPYYQATGYVGGLNAAGKAAYEAALNVEGDLAKLMALQKVVYDHDNNNSEDDPTNPNYIVHYTPGYYRLHNQPGSSGITTPRYMSGYTHLIESTDYDNNSGADADGDGNNDVDILPLHFYEVEKYDVNNPTFNDLSTVGTDYTESVATRGDIPLVTVDKDPASIFYFAGAAAASPSSTMPSSTMQTQGLYVKGNKMTATPGDATSFNIIDIGAGIVALQGGDYFLKYAQTNPKYDLKFDNTLSTVESTRWCMQPVQKGATAGNGEMPLKVATNNGGDEHYYTTFYAPFDVLLTGANDVAYIIPPGQWPAMTTASTQYILYPKEIGEYNTAESGCPENYRGNNQFVPAGTPVIIRTKNTSGEVTMALPTATPSTRITTDLSGQYLEQMLTQSETEYVFVLGRSYTHSDQFTYNGGTGVVTPAGLEFDRGVGFYKNANNNRESNATKTMWTRNNKYVYGNKIYYRAAISSSAPEMTRGIEFVPIIFDDESEEELDPDGSKLQMAGDNCIYDLQGRKVATEEQVKDGTWQQRLSPGIYILNGQKFSKK